MEGNPYDQEERKAGGEDPAEKPDEPQSETFHSETDDAQESADCQYHDDEQKLSFPTVYPAHSSAPPTLGKSKSRGKQGVRKGKWTPEEERYTNKVIEVFNAGLLKLPDNDRNVTLRAYLAEKLGCDPMRITKKYTGAACLGKRVYHFDYLNANQEEAERARQELQLYENSFRDKLDQLSRLRNSNSSVDVEHSRIVSTPAIDALMQRTDRAFPNWPDESGRPIPTFSVPFYYPSMPPPPPLAPPGYLPHCDPRMGFFVRELPPGAGKASGVEPGLPHAAMDYSRPPSQLRQDVEYEQPVFYPTPYPLMSAYFIPPPMFAPYDSMRAPCITRMAHPRPLVMPSQAGHPPPSAYVPYLHTFPVAKPGTVPHENLEVVQETPHETVESVMAVGRRGSPTEASASLPQSVDGPSRPSSLLPAFGQTSGEDVFSRRPLVPEGEEGEQMNKRPRTSSPSDSEQSGGTPLPVHPRSSIHMASDGLAVPAGEG